MEPQPASNPPPHILLVEDDPAQLADIRGILEAFGCRITGAESAEAALRLAERTRFDVILTDNILPGMTGLQALPRLRASGAPVLVMSSQYGPDTEKDALLIGAAAFLKKPLDREHLSRLIRRPAASMAALLHLAEHGKIKRPFREWARNSDRRSVDLQREHGADEISPGKKTG